MRVLVSGGTGYLGSRVIKKLEAGNNQIICMTRSPPFIYFLPTGKLCGSADMS